MGALNKTCMHQKIMINKLPCKLKNIVAIVLKLHSRIWLLKQLKFWKANKNNTKSSMFNQPSLTPWRQYLTTLDHASIC